MRGSVWQWLPRLAALLAVGAGCGESAGTYVRLDFGGTVNQDKPIASLAVALVLVDAKGASRSSSTSFPAPNGQSLTLPTSAVLEIGSGEGILFVSAQALASDQSVLGMSSGSGTVKKGKTSHISVLFGATVADAGAGGPGPVDTRPASLDGADVAGDAYPGADRPVLGEVPAVDAGASPDQPLDAVEVAGDGPPDVPGAGGAGGGTTTGGAGGARSGGAGGAGAGGAGSGGTGATYLLIANPPAIDFGIVAPGGASPAQTFTIINKGDAPTPLLRTVVTDPVHFPLARDACAGKALAPFGSCDLSFTFNPTAPGAVHATATVGAADGSGLPAKLSLSGTGSGGAASLSLSPTNVAFPVVDLNQSASAALTLTNGGDASAGTITLQVTGSPGFKITNDACSGLALGGLRQCPFTLVFAPTSFGPATATVTATSSTGLTASSTATGIGRDHVLLTIQFAGAGGGVVNGVTPACASPTPCQIDVARTDPTALPRFELAAAPNNLSVFGGWSGACAGTAGCALVMDAPRTVTATFEPRMVPLSLTVLGVSGGKGVVAAADGSLSCDAACPNLSHAATTSLTLVAKPATGTSFIGWTGGPCRGAKPECTFSLTEATSITASFGPPAFMFVTSSTVIPGNLGGVEGGDKECQRLAEKAGLPGSYMAWLSTTGIDARLRVGKGGWVRTDGRPFARSLKTLADPLVLGYPTVFYPPRVDELGNDFGNKPLRVATGGSTDGPALGNQCEGYTKPAGDLYVGDASSGAYAWSYTELVKDGCAQPHHLYCFRTDEGAELTPPGQSGRRVFISSKPYAMTSGFKSDPNVVCQKDADAAGLPSAARFVAFLATSTVPAIKLLGGSGVPWKRLDEVVVASQEADFATGKLLAPINLGPDGVTYLPNRVWTGAADPTALGTATCGDWTNPPASASGLVGDSRTTAAPPWFSLGSRAAVSCASTDTHLMCIEP